ncbi:hypothetical protein [Pararhizobium capsulatum]|uniref:hypothetical protein n=1 Tax=Pararhizobium capsulatum TaxID=34014 RepID=UPI0027D7EE93|nr:hypothetical protein [Pararhizobium capsulatum]
MAFSRVDDEIRQLARDHPVGELWKVITGAEPGRTAASQITLLDSVRYSTGFLSPEVCPARKSSLSFRIWICEQIQITYEGCSGC